MSLLRSLLLTTPLIGIITVLMGTVSMLASLVDRDGRILEALARTWGKSILAVCFIRVRGQGVEKLDVHANYVFAANHGSFLDIPAILSVLPQQSRFFAKKGLFSIPFLGTHLRRAGHLPVDRSSPRSSLKSMAEGARIVASGKVSIFIFPEGGRSLEGLREFTEGAAYIAIKSGVPIVPVAIVGMRELLPTGGVHIRSGRVTVCVGDPIPTTGLALSDRASLTLRLYAEIARMMGLPATAPPVSASAPAPTEK